MNRELKRVSIVVLLLFIALFTSTSIIQVVQADTLAGDDRNTRTLYDSYSAERGPILAGGTPIAESVPASDVYAFQRVYANGPLYAPITGFIPINGAPIGIEQKLNDYLSGTSNSQFLDSINALITGQPPRGASVETSINPTLQQAAWDALGDLQGAVVVLEPGTGRVLAMVSKPSYDPNSLALHDSELVDATYQALVNDPANPLFNRAIGGDMNPPGSVFKLVLMAAALSDGLAPTTAFDNAPSYTLPGSTSQVINSGGGTCGEGATATIETALRLSCNTIMAQLGVQLGDKKIRAMAEAFGFNVELEIPLDVEASIYPRVLDDAQTALSAFGQYEVRATPLQIAMVSAAIANGGKLMKPNVIDSINAPDLSPLQVYEPEEFSQPITREVAVTLTQMMINGVNDGAASNARIDGVSVAGKTGTAENGGDDPYTLWFTGFAPADNPLYSITVLVEDGGGLGQEGFGNGTAAPIAKKVLEAVLNQ